MTLGSVGTISSIRVEFGGSAPDKLADYYRGGVEGVPNAQVNIAIPTSGSISFSDFDGTSATPVDVAGDSLVDVATDPDTAEVGYRINSAGTEQSFEGLAGAYATINTWLNDGAASAYDCRLTVNTGDAPSGSATGAWLICSTTRAWTLAESGLGTKVNDCTIAIRDGTTLSVLASATVTMNVTHNI